MGGMPTNLSQIFRQGNLFCSVPFFFWKRPKTPPTSARCRCYGRSQALLSRERNFQPSILAEKTANFRTWRMPVWKEKKRKREDGDEGIPMTELEKIVFLESKRNEMESGTRVHGFFSKTLNELLDKYDPSPSGSSSSSSSSSSMSLASSSSLSSSSPLFSTSGGRYTSHSPSVSPYYSSAGGSSPTQIIISGNSPSPFFSFFSFFP